jgi:MFS family permease
MTQPAPTHRRIFPWIVWIIGTLYFLFDYTNQVVPGAMKPELQRAFDANAMQFGFLAASYFYIYAIMQIPVGLLDDRFGPKRPLAIAATVAVAGCFLFTQADSVLTATLARMMIGIGASFSFVSVLMLIRHWFAPGRFSLLIGLTNMAGMIGAIGADNVLSWSAQTTEFGWQWTIAAVAAIGGLVMLGIIFVVRDHPAGTRRAPEAPPPLGTAGVWGHLKTIVRSPQMWISGVYAATIATVFMTFGAAWGSLYVERRFGISTTAAASMASLVFAGAIPGSFFFGWFSGAIKRRKIPMIIGGAGALASYVLLAYVIGDSVWLGRACLLGMGFFGCGNVVAYAIGDDNSPRGGEGIGLGFINTCLIGGGAGFGPVIGVLLDWQQPHATHSVDYTMAELNIAFVPLLICLVVSFVASLVVRETRCRRIANATPPPLGTES